MKQAAAQKSPRDEIHLLQIVPRNLLQNRQKGDHHTPCLC